MSQLNQETAKPTTEGVRDADLAAFELSCVHLICQLEHLLATAKESDRSDQVEDSAKLANKILGKLINFADEFLPGSDDAILEELGKAARSSATHKDALSKRSWGTTLKSLFLVDAVDEKSKATHEKLGKDLACACASILNQAIQLVGEDSEIGQQVSQSTTVFVNEFEAVW